MYHKFCLSCLKFLILNGINMLFSKVCLKNFQYLLQAEEKCAKSSHLHCYSERKTEENENTSSDHPV